MLTHDFSEAYVGDIPSPLKALLPDYKVIESSVQNQLYAFAGLKEPNKYDLRIIKYIDELSLHFEGVYLTHNIDGWAYRLKVKDETFIAPREWFVEMDKDEVKKKLIEEFYDLKEKSLE